MVDLGFINDIDSEATAMSTWAGKIDQSGISVPIAHAAAGNTNYTDAYTTARDMGFVIKEAPMAGVIPASQASFYDPIGRNRVTGEFGESRSYYTAGHTHQGTDIAVPMNAPINAPFSGKVLRVGANDSYGNFIDIVDDSGQFTARFAHATSFGVRAGQSITAAQQLGSAGSTGRSTGPHIHYEARYKGQLINPRTLSSIYANAKKGSKTYNVNLSLSDANYYRLMDTDTGLMSIKGLNEVVNMVKNSKAYGSNVQHIYTNRPELLEDKPEYADYKSFRNMKGADGKPLFAKSDKNGLSIVMKREEGNKFNPIAIPALAEDGSRTSTEALPGVSAIQNRALLEVLQGRGINYRQGEPFGLAELTEEDYLDYGIPMDALENPVLQNRVLVQEFQRGMDLLGSERKAVYALAGGEFSDEDGNIKSWKEIKADKEAFMKNWFIRPVGDKAKRDKANKIVSNYDIIRHRLGGR